MARRFVFSPRFLWSALGVLLLIIGVSGVPGDLVTWAAWIDSAARWLSTSGGERLILALGLAIVAGANLGPYWKRVPHLAEIVTSIEHKATLHIAPRTVQRPSVEIAAVRLQWTGGYYIDTGDPILEIQCPKDKVELLKMVRRNVDEYTEEVHRSDMVATKEGRGRGYPVLFCPAGDHPILLEADSHRLEDIFLRAEKIIIGKIREAEGHG